MAPCLAVALSVLLTSIAQAQAPAPVSPAPAASGAAASYDGTWTGTTSGSGGACPAWKFTLSILAGAVTGHGVLPIATHEGHLYNVSSENTDWDVLGTMSDDGNVSFTTTTSDKAVDPKRRSVKFAGKATDGNLQLKQQEPTLCDRSLTLTRSKPK